MPFAIAFPWLIVVILVYNIVVFLSSGALSDIVVSWTMISGGVIEIRVGDLIIVLGLAVLFVEMLKSARSATSTIMDHMLSTGVFIVALVEFLVVKEAATAIFLILVMISLIDVVAGYTVSIRTARRDIAFGGEM